jgi:hypothetical protein
LVHLDLDGGHGPNNLCVIFHLSVK